MGQLLPFTSASPAWPDRANRLDTAECTFLIAVRWWVEGYRGDQDPVPRLCRGLKLAGVGDAAFPLNDFMAVVARANRHQIAIHQPRCHGLSQDEQQLLYVASLAQTGDRARATRALSHTLLEEAGAAFALGPLMMLGRLFAGADLIFSQRRAPIEESSRFEDPNATIH